jgi:hypothetical protein
MHKATDEHAQRAVKLIQSLAVKRMRAIKEYRGARIPKLRLIQAEDNFWTRVSIRMLRYSLDPLEAIDQTPYAFSTGKSKIRIVANLTAIEAEYRNLLPKLKRLQSKNWRADAAHRLALAEALGITKDCIVKKYLTLRPSELALSHLAKKYQIKSADTLRKDLAFHRKTQRAIGILREFAEDYEK